MAKKTSDNVIIGLDIGPGSIKGVRIEKDGDKVFVVDFIHSQFSTQNVQSEVLSRQIKEIVYSLVDEKTLKKTKIYTIISGNRLCIRSVRLPFIPKQELPQAVKSKIRKYVSADLSQVDFNFSLLGEIQERGVKKLEVVFSAIQKSFLEEYLSIFRHINIEPDIITTSCFSGWNLLKELG